MIKSGGRGQECVIISPDPPVPTLVRISLYNDLKTGKIKMFASWHKENGDMYFVCFHFHYSMYTYEANIIYLCLSTCIVAIDELQRMC